VITGNSVSKRMWEKLTIPGWIAVGCIVAPQIGVMSADGGLFSRVHDICPAGDGAQFWLQSAPQNFMAHFIRKELAHICIAIAIQNSGRA